MEKPDGQDKKHHPNGKPHQETPQTPPFPSEISNKHNTEHSNRDSDATSPIKQPSPLFRLIEIITKPTLTDWIIGIATVVIAIKTITYTEYSGKQWQTMEKQNTVALQNLSTSRASIRIAYNAMLDARNAGKAQAQSARKSLDATIRNFQLEQRAWVTVKGAEHNTLKEGQKIIAKVIFHNSGHSPALDVVAHNTISLFGQKIPDPMPPGEYVGLTSNSVIGPGTNFIISITKKDVLTSAHIQAISDKQLRIFVYGRITYRDIFHFKHSTEYCLVNKAGTLNFDVWEKNNTAN